MIVHINNSHVMRGVDDNAEPDEEEAYEDFLKMLEQKILSKMNLGAMSSIRKAVIRNLKEAVVNPQTGVHEQVTKWMIATEGINMAALMEHDAVYHARTYSNDVVDVFMVLGIKAARQLLMNEIGNDISFDGSNFKMRYLVSLVNSMTYRGPLMPRLAGDC